MGLFSSDGVSRAQRKAEAKALKAKAKMEAKLDAKDRRKSQKSRRKIEHKYYKKDLKAQNKAADHAAKAQAKIAKAEAKTAAAEAKTVAAKAKAAADAKPYSPASVKRYFSVARLVAPVVVPIAYRAAVAGRGKITALQAGRAGVSPEVLQQFSGHGATLSARIETTRTALEKVSDTDPSADSGDFVTAMTGRLDNLIVAVDAAESMAPAQRRKAHQAIDSELGAIDADILARLGVRS